MFRINYSESGVSMVIIINKKYYNSNRYKIKL